MEHRSRPSYRHPSSIQTRARTRLTKPFFFFLADGAPFCTDHCFALRNPVLWLLIWSSASVRTPYCKQPAYSLHIALPAQSCRRLYQPGSRLRCLSLQTCLAFILVVVVFVFPLSRYVWLAYPLYSFNRCGARIYSLQLLAVPG